MSVTATSAGTLYLVGVPTACIGGAMVVHGGIVANAAIQNLASPQAVNFQENLEWGSGKEIQNNNGKPATENKPKMLGENGVTTESKTVWQQKGSKARIDIENQKPGERPGQVHYHDAKNTKYIYDPETQKFYTKNSKTSKCYVDAPRSINKLLKNRSLG